MMFFLFYKQKTAYESRISDWSSDVCSSDLTLEGDRRYVPWVNAPPGTTQDMGVFLLPDSGDAASVTKAALAYTRGDRFKALDGHRTFTSHYHVEHTEAFLNTARFQQSTGVPDGLESDRKSVG